jgi:hypothetical protein
MSRGAEENSSIMSVCSGPRILMCEHQSSGFVGWESVSAGVAERTFGRLKRPAERPIPVCGKSVCKPKTAAARPSARPEKAAEKATAGRW